MTRQLGRAPDRAPPLPLVCAMLAMWTMTACASGPSAGDTPPDPSTRPPPVVLLVSVDGFRPDYLDPSVTPHLLALAGRGVRAERMVPAFPTKTFPNHYSIVTGVRPDAHGLVANNIWDPTRDERYGLGDRKAVQDAAWYGGEPVWVAAEQAGMPTAPMFWPGSEAPIRGTRPTHWLPYDGRMPYRDRVDWVLDRLDGTAGERVRFATLYFDAVDGAGHDHGPYAPETRAAVARVDSVIGYLVGELQRRRLPAVNVIVVSDHGMSQLSPERVVLLDDHVDLDAVRVIDWSPVLAIWPGAGGPAALEDARRALSAVTPHLQVYRPRDIPDRYEFGTHERVAPLIAIADPGWSITSREYFDRNFENFSGGNHGYDPWSDDMSALFLAAGPAFRPGAEIDAMRVYDAYQLMMRILGLPARPGDGDLGRVASLLATNVRSATE